MISRECQNTYSTIAIVKSSQRFWRCMKHLFRRYGEWIEMKRQQEDLLRMEDRMLKDIGLSRAAVTRISRNQKFWRHMFQPEPGDNESEPNQKEEAACELGPIQDQPSSDFCLGTPGRSCTKT